MTEKELPEYKKEARLFGKYLIGKNVNDTVCNLYSSAIEKLALTCTGRDRKIEHFILRFPFWIGCVDAALTITGKQSVFRKKIFVMLAILESMPEYAEYFLPKKFPFFYIFKIIAAGIRSVYRFVIGFVIIKFFRNT
ncbi:MAG: hypothetical protein ABR968_11680 [Bacteroidales bacterium]|jgi:hypothetical protein